MHTHPQAKNPSAPLPRAIPHERNIEGACAAAVLVASVSLVVAVVLRANTSTMTPVMELAAIVTVVAWALLSRLCAHFGLRVLTAATFGLAGASVPMALMGHAAVREDLAVATTFVSECGNGVLGVMFAVFAGPAAAIVAATMLANRVLPRESASAARLARLVSAGALVLAAITLAGSVRRSVGRVEPDDFIATLPIVAVFPQAPPSAHSRRERDSLEDHARVVDALTVDGVRVRRGCSEGSCELLLDREGATNVAEFSPPPARGLRLRQLGAGVATVHRLDGKWLVRVGEDAVAFEGPSFLPSRVDTDYIGERLAPPRAWIVGAAAGLVFALLLLAWPTRRLALPRPEDCEEGELMADGTFRRADGTLAGTLAVSGLHVGPAIWLRPRDLLATAYRDDPRPIEHAWMGSLRALAWAHEGPRTQRAALAVSTLALTSAPLAGAGFFFLLHG